MIIYSLALTNNQFLDFSIFQFTAFILLDFWSREEPVRFTIQLFNKRVFDADKHRSGAARFGCSRLNACTPGTN